jgi:hypothetical protein
MSSSDDEDGGADVLVRLGGALARANRNDEAATALHKALSIMGRGSDEAFKARENFMVVVNRSVIPSRGANTRVEIAYAFGAAASTASTARISPTALQLSAPPHSGRGSPRMASIVCTRHPIKLVTICFSCTPFASPASRSLFQPLHGFRALHNSTFLAELQAAIEAGMHNALFCAPRCTPQVYKMKIFPHSSSLSNVPSIS